MSFSSFQKLVNNKLKFSLYLVAKLPSAYFCGVRVKEINEHLAIVTVPYKWLSQNPFRSIYFACQAMAAEMSTGLLAMMHTHKSSPAISMLVVGLEAKYFKKATSPTLFTCEDGGAISNTITDSINSGEGRSIKAKSVGRNLDGEIVAEFFITWSFKAKRQTNG